MSQLLHVDVFTEQRLGGNPLAVFVDPPQLDASQYQAWASEMNLSESIFVWAEAEDRYRARIFTPRRELGFAGHPTLGAAAVLRSLGAITRPAATQVTSSGACRIWYDTAPERAGLVWFEPPVGEPGEVLDRREVGSALGIPTLWISENLPPQTASVGISHLVVQIHPDHVSTIQPNLARVAELLEAHQLTGVMVWAFTGANRVHARTFAPAVGVGEDPATGSAAAALGVILSRAAGVTDPTRYLISQGAEVNRPSVLWLTLNQRALGAIAVGGAVQPVYQAEVDLNPSPSS